MIQSGADKYKGQWTTNNSTDGYLLDEGAPVNTQDVNGATSLSKLVRLLLSTMELMSTNYRKGP